VPDRDRVLIWRGTCPVPLEPGGFVAATIESLHRGGDATWTATTHEHRQRHHPEELLQASLAIAGLAIRRVAGMRTDGSLTAGFDERENSKALYVVARA
jgi:hypothetical protein